MKGVDELLKGINQPDDDSSDDEKNSIAVSLGSIDAEELPKPVRKAILKYIKRKGLSEKNKEMKEIKRVKLKPEWKKIAEEITSLQKTSSEIGNKAVFELEKMKSMMESKKALFWGLVERELDEYEKKMRYSVDDDEIIIFDEDKDDPEDEDE